MASHVVVIDSAARRQQIKTTPGTYLRDILEEACKKFGNKNPDQFILSDNSRPPKTLDLSLTFRLAGLANGQRLQLVQGSRSPSVVSIALKLPELLGGQRLQDKFPSDTSIWLVLRKFEETPAVPGAQKLNLTQRGIASTQNGAGRLVYEQPVVKILQRELSDFVALQKTLAQLGYNSGSVLLNLDFRNSGTPMEDAVKQISGYFDATTPKVESQAVASTRAEAVSAVPAATEATAMSSNSPVFDNTTDGDSALSAPAVAPAGSASAQTSDATPTTGENAISTPPAQPGFAVYKPPSSSTPRAAAQAHNEADFVPTVEHAQAHQAVLNRASQNRRLQSDAELAAEQQRKSEAMSSIQSARIRVRFPDQMQVDLTITPADSPTSLYTKVRDMLRDSTLGFELRYMGPKGTAVTLEQGGKSAETSLIRGMGWKGAVLVTMVWSADVPLERRGRVLKDSLVGQATELSVPQVKDGAGGSPNAGSTQQEQQGAAQKKGGGKADLEAKMKKFLGFGKK